MVSVIQFLALILIATNIVSVQSQQLLGFYYGSDESYKSPNHSHFWYDWTHVNVDRSFYWIFSIITTFWTVIWLYWHNSHKPSYKFEFHLLSRISIRLHIMSGSLEFILLYFAYFLPEDTGVEYTVYIIVAFDMIHGMTGYYQTPSVYGQKYLTIPAYVWVITLKLAIAIYLAVEPLSLNRLWALYFSHAQFTWLRFLFYIFAELKIFTKSLYTVCMFAGVILLQSFISGCNGCMLFVIYIIIVITVFRKVHPDFILGGQAERARNSAYFLDNSHLEYLTEKLGQHKDIKDKASVLFDWIDVDDNGTIEYHELFELFTNCGVCLHHAKEIFETMDIDGDGGIDREEFISASGTQKLVFQFEEDIDEELKMRYSHARDWEASKSTHRLHSVKSQLSREALPGPYQEIQ